LSKLTANQTSLTKLYCSMYASKSGEIKTTNKAQTTKFTTHITSGSSESV